MNSVRHKIRLWFSRDGEERAETLLVTGMSFSLTDEDDNGYAIELNRMGFVVRPVRNNAYGSEILRAPFPPPKS